MTSIPIVGNAAKTMTSREIADLTGKEHRHVLADARVMLESLGINCAGFSAQYKDASGKTNPMFILPKRETLILVSGYSVAMRAKIIDRWHELEAERATGHPDFGTDEGKLLMIQELAAKQLALLADNKLIAAERDHAIATKAQISDRKTATAMATASAKAREVARLKHELGYSARNATILQVERKLGRDFDFHPLRRWCNLNKVAPDTVPDKRYPNGVKAWPAGAWADVYGVDLVELFGEVAA